MADLPLVRDGEGVRLALAVRPGAKRDRLAGVIEAPDPATGRTGPRLKLEIAAPPADGKANAAVLALLAKTFRLPKTSLSLISGATGRHKVVHVAGEPAALERAIRGGLENETTRKG